MLNALIASPRKSKSLQNTESPWNPLPPDGWSHKPDRTVTGSRSFRDPAMRDDLAIRGGSETIGDDQPSSAVWCPQYGHTLRFMEMPKTRHWILY
ncbi:GD10803 [Drosophila simulans]|uniref:GD10803 n=1 Tax=Drosophila simulans TaxID=7240 RepID=B4QBM2_DROSI|nr:GD10803 [Drosophila simulans]